MSEHRGGGSRVTGSWCRQNEPLVQMQLLTMSCSGPACRCGTWTERESMGRAWSEVSRHWQGCVRQAHTVGQSAWLPFPSSSTPRDPNAPPAGIHPFRLLTGVTAQPLGVSLSLFLLQAGILPILSLGCYMPASSNSCCPPGPLHLPPFRPLSIPSTAALPEVLPSSISLPSQGVTLIPDPNPVLACKAPGACCPLSSPEGLSHLRCSLSPSLLHPQQVGKQSPGHQVPPRSPHHNPDFLLMVLISSATLLGSKCASATRQFIKSWRSQGTGRR